MKHDVFFGEKHISGMKLYNFTWFDQLRSLMLSHIFRYLPTIFPILPTSFPFPFPFANAGGPRFRIAQATQVSRETARSGPMEVESKGCQGRQGRPLPDFRFQIIIIYRYIQIYIYTYIYIYMYTHIYIYIYTVDPHSFWDVFWELFLSFPCHGKIQFIARMQQSSGAVQGALAEKHQPFHRVMDR